jgi:hypothetical protein
MPGGGEPSKHEFSIETKVRVGKLPRMALSLFGIVLALAALLLPFAIERKRRPRLRIEAGQWKPEQDVDWEFAPIRVVNEPLDGFWGRALTRQSAEGCIVSITIHGEGAAKPVVSDLPGRWSGTPQPYRTEVQPDGQGGWLTVDIFDHSLVPDSFRFSVPSTGDAEEVAVAVWRDGEAHAFNSWSYAHLRWAKPEWKLDPGIYEITVRAKAPGCETSGTFTLTVAETGLSDLVPGGANPPWRDDG